MILENKAAAARREANGQDVYSCEEILGTMKSVQNFAAFFAQNRIEIAMIRKAFLMDFIEGNVEMKPVDAFRLALDLFSGFFEKADEEVDLYITAAHKANAKKEPVDAEEN